MKKLLLIAVSLFLFASCATIITGTNQTVVFAAPAGTSIYMDGMKIAEITEGEQTCTAHIKRSISSQLLVAKKEGYKNTTFQLKAKVNGVVFVNIILGGIIGGAVDLATGAAGKYQDYIEIELEPIN